MLSRKQAIADTVDLFNLELVQYLARLDQEKMIAAVGDDKLAQQKTMDIALAIKDFIETKCKENFGNEMVGHVFLVVQHLIVVLSQANYARIEDLEKN